MEENKKSSQAAVTASEDDVDSARLPDKSHKLCDFCRKAIVKSDNYCSYCGRVNPK